jgi:hypothetical protein
MGDLVERGRKRSADAAALADEALEREIERLESIERAAQHRDDELSPAGYAWLYALRAERDVRRGEGVAHV